MYNSWHMSEQVCTYICDIVWPRALAPSKESMTEFSFCFERETKLINRLQLAIRKKKTKNTYIKKSQWHIMWAFHTLDFSRIHNSHTVGTR